MVVAGDTAKDIRPSFLRWLSCPDHRCLACQAAETEFVSTSLDEQTLVLLAALDLGFANPQSRLSVTWSSGSPTGFARAPQVAAGAESKTLSPACVRWLACSDQRCPACRSAEAEYQRASFEQQTDVLLCALQLGFAEPGDPLFSVASYSEPLVPLAHVATAGHTSTTHRRRPAPIVAAFSAVAAAALAIALSLTGGPGKPVVHAALHPAAAVPSGGPSGGQGQPLDTTALPSGGIAPTAQLTTVSTGVTTAAAPSAAGGAPPATPTSGDGSPGAGNVTTTPTQPSPPPNNSPQPLPSVVSLVSSVPAQVVAVLP